MGRPVYIADPVVAAHYHVHPGEWSYVADDVEAIWLIANKHGYGLNNPTAVPAPYFVNPDAPPFVPLPDPAPPDTQPATMSVTASEAGPNVFNVTFAGGPDTAQADGSFFGIDDTGGVVASSNWTQPPGTTPTQAVTLLQTALQAHGAQIATQKFGAMLEVRGTGGVVLRAVGAYLRVPNVAADPAPTPSPPPPAPPPPAPAPPPRRLLLPRPATDMGGLVVIFAFDPVEESDGGAGLLSVAEELADRLVAESRAERIDGHQNDSLRFVTGSAANLAAGDALRAKRGHVGVRKVRSAAKG